jgi:hypothetical protein
MYNILNSRGLGCGQHYNILAAYWKEDEIAKILLRKNQQVIAKK